MKRQPTNIPASVRQRLLDLSGRRGEDFQSILVRFANERLLYRLATSPVAERFVLKGAMLLYFWSAEPFRATQDIDLLGRGEVTAESLGSTFRDLCEMQVTDDGLKFDPTSVRVGLIREDQEYGGFRVKLQARLTSARIDLQVDVGIGDAVVPRATVIDYPTLLDFPAARMRAYSREAAVAEKYHAMVELGLENSRMKDFFDVWALAREFDFDGARLASAIEATFRRRRTPIPEEPPVALTPAFAQEDAKLKQWRGFLARARVRRDTPTFDQVIRDIATFLGPAAEAARQADGRVAMRWAPGGPWAPAG
ncbi:MAG: nucleotidyl transferase AbiEii/AbiGii toxin family protein [Deltaproteobacteria bacterium]